MAWKRVNPTRTDLIVLALLAVVLGLLVGTLYGKPWLFVVVLVVYAVAVAVYLQVAARRREAHRQRPGST